MAITSSQGLALARSGFGLYFLAQAFDKTTHNWFSDGSALAQQLQGSLPRAEAFYRPFLEGTVLPHVGLFAQLVNLGEWVVGLSLALGLLTRFGGLVGVLLNLNYMLMKGLPNIAGSSDRLFLLAELVFIVTAAGLVWGLDRLLARSAADVPVVGWLVGARRVGPRLRAVPADNPPVPA